LISINSIDSSSNECSSEDFSSHEFSGSDQKKASARKKKLSQDIHHFTTPQPVLVKGIHYNAVGEEETQK